jgi:hypothetical protein
MTNRGGAVLHKSSLAINDITGSYHISSLNKGGYGIGNSNTSHAKYHNTRSYGANENRYTRKRSIILSMRVD